MRAVVVLIAFAVLAVVGSLPDDASLARRLIGTWRGGRHDTCYFADGTWMMDPQEYALLGGQNTHGRWYIRHGRLIETWRFNGELSDSSTVNEIIELTATRFRFRTLSQDGPGRPANLVLPSGVYIETRVPDPSLPGKK